MTDYVTPEQMVEAQRRQLYALEAHVRRDAERLRRIASLLYGPALEPAAPEAVLTAYAIAREAR